MTPETAQFLLDLLETLVIEVGKPGFMQAATQIAQAQTELQAIIDKKK